MRIISTIIICGFGLVDGSIEHFTEVIRERCSDATSRRVSEYIWTEEFRTDIVTVLGGEIYENERVEICSLFKLFFDSSDNRNIEETLNAISAIDKVIGGIGLMNRHAPCLRGFCSAESVGRINIVAPVVLEKAGERMITRLLDPEYRARIAGTPA
jgi:hypothetical protein